MKEQHLGDGVYASFDGYQIWLDTHARSLLSIALPWIRRHITRWY